MRIIVRDNLGNDVTHEREWYIRTDGKIFYYTGDIDCPLYIVDNDYTFEVDLSPQVYNLFEEKNNEWQRNYLGKWIGLEYPKIDYPDCCNGCSNNPKNGGSGICNCTLPYMQDPTNYTVQYGDACMANNISGHVYFVDNIDALKTHKADANRVAEAKERTEKYIKRD